MDKPIEWRGSSLDDLREFPEAARRVAGYELRKLQRGEAPDDWRPFHEEVRASTRFASTPPTDGSE